MSANRLLGGFLAAMTQFFCAHEAVFCTWTRRLSISLSRNGVCMSAQCSRSTSNPADTERFSKYHFVPSACL